MLVVDFDGTLCDFQFPECGPPIAPVIAALRAVHEAGWRIMIHSCRTNPYAFPKWGGSEERLKRVDGMIAWLAEHQVPYDSIWGISTMLAAPGRTWDYAIKDIGKPVGDVYWDDRFPGWREISADAQTLINWTERTAGIKDHGPAYVIPFCRDDIVIDRAMGRAVGDVIAELRRATQRFGAFNTCHEGYAVILEELDELWDSIRANKRDDVRDEAIHVAAMAIRFLMDCCRDAKP